MVSAELFYLLTLVNSIALLGCLYELMVYRRRRRLELYSAYRLAITKPNLSQEAFNDLLEELH
jgi:hypothetical protein